MSHATTAAPKPSLKAPWRMGDTVVGRGNAGWTTWKSGHSCPCQSCVQWPSAAKTGRGSLLNYLWYPPEPIPSRDRSELSVPTLRYSLQSDIYALCCCCCFFHIYYTHLFVCFFVCVRERETEIGDCPFVYTFQKFGVDKSMDWSTIPVCPSLMCFFNRGDAESINTSRILCSMFVYALFLCKFVSGLIL